MSFSYGSDDERSAVEETESVWHALVKTFTEMVHGHGPHLEQILNMIRTHITYDDPGLFPTTLLTDEGRQKCRCSNYWLIYQLLRIASLETYECISESYTGLQKEIIKACFIKQRWLVRDICSQFVTLLDQMNGYKNGSTETIRTFYDVFTNVTTTQGIHFGSAIIEIDSTARCALIRTHCVHTLSELISLLVHQHDEGSLQLVNESACTVLRTLVLGSLEEKHVSMKFFQNYFKHHAQAVHVSFPVENMCRVMNLIAVSLKRIDAWHMAGLTNKQEMDRFVDTVTELLTTLTSLQPRPALGRKSMQKICTIVEEILCTGLQYKRDGLHPEERRQEQLHLALLRFLQHFEPERLHTDVTFSALIECYGTSANIDGEVANQIVNQIKAARNDSASTNTCSKLFVPLVSTAWAMLLHTVEQNDLNGLERALSIANMVSFKLSAEASSSSPHVQECFFFDSKLSLLEAAPLIALFDTRQRDLIGMVVSIVHLSDCQTLNVQQQHSLLQVLFAPFEPVNSDGRAKQRECWNAQINTELCHYALKQWCYLRADKLHEEVISSGITGRLTSLLLFIATSKQCDDLKHTLLKAFPQLILSSKIALSELFPSVLVPLLLAKDSDAVMVDVIELLRLLCCLSASCTANFLVYQVSETKRAFQCNQCNDRADSTKRRIETVSEKLSSEGKSIELESHMRAALLKLAGTNEEATLLALINFLPTALKHSFACMMEPELVSCWIRLFGCNAPKVRRLLTKHIPCIFRTLAAHLANEPERYEALVASVIEQLLSAAQACIMKKTTYAEQMGTVRMVAEFAGASYHAALLWKSPEDKETLFHCVRILIFLLMHPASLVTHEAALTVTEMCAKQGTSPSKILSWYRHDIVKQIVGLAVSNYVRGGITLHQSVNIVSHAFESRDPEDFVGKYYKTMMAMLLPWCVRSSRYGDELLREVATILRKELEALLSMSFLSIYTCLFISESVEVTNKCIEYIMQLTGNSFFHLLHSDIKRTVSEVLIYYHINPECALHAFRSLLSKDTDVDEVPTARIAEYIAERFLGVLANLEVTLFNPDGEKFLKRLALLSLGDIIRLLGGEHITPFRFKVMALLRTALALPDEGAALAQLCVKTWRIFICTVDVRQLGSLLSTIFVTLEPLLDAYGEDIGYIFRYLVIENNSLLGNSLGDLFFIGDTNVADDVKKIVASRTTARHGHHGADNEQFVNRLEELIRHCNHENLKVRSYAFSHLGRLCATSRTELNEAILGQHQSISLGTVATMVETLIRGLCEQDATVQQRAAECLGEVGALAPSHLPPNYAPTGAGPALTIHSDCFAIIALRELCRAYQRQKDSKFVDSFSLAIQEVLSERGVSPEADKKREVWETIPERLRPIMEPLLTSCYTSVSKASLTPTAHPVFKHVASSHEWCYQWAYRMIENISVERTRHLLRAFKPSLRCDWGTLTMMLPYILLHSLQLCEGNEQRKLLADELEVVFGAAQSESLSTPAAEKGGTENAAISMSEAEEDLHMPREGKDASGTELALQCAKYAFGLFDFLEQWKRQYFKATGKDTASQHNYDVVDTFLNTFDSDLLARVNFQCNEYARALQYVEHSLSGDGKSKNLQGKLSILSEIYSNLGDTDSVEGVMALKATEPTLHELIRHHKATGRLQEAVACYDQLLQLTSIEEHPQGLLYVNDMIECYLKLDQPKTALQEAESLLARFHDTTLHQPLLDLQAEPLYRLARFEELDELLQQRQADEASGTIDDGQRHWGVICGSLISRFRQPDYGRFCSEIERARQHVVQGSCSDRTIARPLDAQLSTYESRYDQALKLHIIQEFVKFGQIMHSLRPAANNQRTTAGIASTAIEHLKSLVDDMNARLEVLQPNAATIEPIISIRRILLKEIRRTVDDMPCDDPAGEQSVRQLRHLVDQTIGQLWMKSTELASRDNMYQQASLYILQAESYRPPELFIQNAKLLWDRRDATGALEVLERGVNEILVSSTDRANLKSVPKEIRLIHAEAKLLIAAYNAEASNISASINQRYFKEAVELNPESELPLVRLAQYVDRLYSSCSATDQNTPNGWEMLFEVMKCYGKSMLYGSSYIYQSMPRVLSIWLDSTAKTWPKCGETSSSSSSMSRKIAQSMNKLANKFKDTLSPYFFFTAFSQLVSRVAHPSPETFQVLKAIIVKLLLNYPQQTLWMMLSVYKSSYTNRVRRCVEIFNDRQLLQADTMQKLIKDFNGLAERLIELTNKEIPGGTRGTAPKITVSSLVRALPKLLAEKNFSSIVIPVEKCMQLVLNKNTGTNFQPYPSNAIYIAGISEEVTVLQSLQRPRKISLRGHDGRLYTMMMKPKDDLRKDFRLMEFNAVVKQYLAQDPDAKARRLHIRTYAVLPLNEECGIIEWISNLNTFRGIVYTYYRQRGQGMTAKELKNYAFDRAEPLATKRHAFETVLVARHPPVFSEWFRDCFPNPRNWYQARSSYIKTTAVSSMVGYILGLGDRHGENILFDSTNGDTVHVDFNCLFNRGETFAVPELVPFRLTHNMVHAMGPLGVEGPYRRSCEIVLRILQTHAPTFMSVLRPFIYDPMVSWSRSSNAIGQTDSGSRDSNVERTDPQAMHNVLNIEERLKGYVKIKGKLSQIPLSVKGQVNHLIKEATDIDNLSQMYIGWSGYT